MQAAQAGIGNNSLIRGTNVNLNVKRHIYHLVAATGLYNAEGEKSKEGAKDSINKFHCYLQGLQSRILVQFTFFNYESVSVVKVFSYLPEPQLFFSVCIKSYSLASWRQMYNFVIYAQPPS